MTCSGCSNTESEHEYIDNVIIPVTDNQPLPENRPVADNPPSRSPPLPPTGTTEKVEPDYCNYELQELSKFKEKVLLSTFTFRVAE